MKVTAALRGGIEKSRGLVDEIRSDVSQCGGGQGPLTKT